MPYRRDRDDRMHEHFEIVEHVLTEMVRQLREINARLVLASLKESSIMLDLSGLQQSVSRVDSVADSAVTLIKEIAAQIAANAGDQQAVESIAADLNAHAEALSAAITENTPSAGGGTTTTPPEQPPAEQPPTNTPPADNAAGAAGTGNNASVETTPNA